MKSPAKLVFLLLVTAGISVHAQTSEQVNLGLPSTYFDMTGMPQWTRDLRRAEIVAFGSFPFTMFIATTAMDSYRYFSHDSNAAYAPWPFKGAGAIEMTTKEHEEVLMYAALGSVALALTDYIIVQVKRNNARKRALALPKGTPIIIKTPLREDTGQGDDGSGNVPAGSGE
jgi:hypothetical protein